MSACLASIRGKIAAQKNIEIIVVNNDADENIESNKEDFPEVVVVNNEKNAGYGQACNLGARQAQGEILLFLNPDTEILSGDISKVLDLFKNEKVAVIGSGLRMEDGKKQKWSAGREINLGNLIKNNLGLSGDNKINASIDPQEVAWVAGTAVFVRKDIFQKMGGFDEKIFMYFEDVDLCRRIKDSGYKIIYYSLFQVLHHGGKSYLRKNTSY